VCMFEHNSGTPGAISTKLGTYIALCMYKGKVKVKVTLRLTVSQSVCLGVGHPFGAHDQILLFLYIFYLLSIIFNREDGVGGPHGIDPPKGYQSLPR
jgi:hypothetical protein